MRAKQMQRENYLPFIMSVGIRVEKAMPEGQKSQQ
jgi:hypothetical protein